MVAGRNARFVFMEIWVGQFLWLQARLMDTVPAGPDQSDAIVILYVVKSELPKMEFAVIYILEK